MLHEEVASQIGLTFEEFWFGNPEIYWYKFKGFKKQIRYNDTLNFELMHYLIPAFQIAFNGNKDGKIKLPTEPMFSEKEHNKSTTRKIIPPTKEERANYDRRVAEIMSNKTKK